MYQPVIGKSGPQLVNEYLDDSFSVESGQDGLTLVIDSMPSGFSALIPERLHGFLLDLRLLRRVPLSYLVPDAALLPPESIRFFNLDLTWVDRVIDGVFSAANNGTLDFTFSYATMALVRERLDKDLEEIANKQQDTEWSPDTDPVTGMLIRSELTRRWPDMIVQPFASLDESKPMPVLRSEPISRDVYIALFAGSPQMVHIREPHVGVRFGVEPTTGNECNGGEYKVDRRDEKGETPPNSDPVCIPLRWGRRLDLLPGLQNQGVSGPRMIALHLEQRPYVQEFKDTWDVPEDRGSVPLSEFEQDGLTSPLRAGRSMDLTALKARQTQLEELENV